MAHIPLVAMLRKDLRLFANDRRALIVSFAMPIAIAAFFGTIFPGGAPGSGEPVRIAVAFVNEDDGPIAAAIGAGAQADKALKFSRMTLDAARDAVRRGKIPVAVVIPKGFGDAAGTAFLSGRDRPQLSLLYDPSHGAELAMVRGILTEHVMRAVSSEMFAGASGRRLVDDALRQLDSEAMPADRKRLLRDFLTSAQALNRDAAEARGPDTRAQGFRVPYTAREEAATARVGIGYNGYAHTFAGMGVQFLLFAAVDLGTGILLERQHGLWDRLRSAPISRFVLLAGKAASGTVITLMTLLVSFAFAMIVFGVRIHGSVLGFLTVALASALMASTFGLLVAAIGNTPAATRGVATFAVLVLTMLGGGWVPMFLFPAWLQRLTVVIPVRWAVDGLDAMTWRGLGFGAAVTPAVVLLAFAAGFGVIAVRRFRWERP